MSDDGYPPVDGTQPCATGDPERFHPNTQPADEVLAECHACPFEGACLAYALRHDVSGVWGGTTHADRVRVRARSGMVAVPVWLGPTPFRARGRRGAA